MNRHRNKKNNCKAASYRREAASRPLPTQTRILTHRCAGSLETTSLNPPRLMSRETPERPAWRLRAKHRPTHNLSHGIPVMRSAIRYSLALITVIAVVAGGCSKRRPAVAAPAPATTAASADRARLDSIERAATARRAAEERERVEAERRAARESVILTLTTPVYFELDQADLTDDGRGLLDAKREVLQRQPEIRIRIEGHADDTGSDEYNMALGERRAAMARRYLVQSGIAEGRMQIVSRGEERPACTDGTEACRSRNRRDEFVLVSGL